MLLGAGIPIYNHLHMGFPRLAIPPNATASSLPKHGFHLGVANAGVFDSILRDEAMENLKLVSKC